MHNTEPSRPPGRLISFEGPEGAGKSTVAALVADALTADGLTVRRTREPGGTDLGKALRQVLLGTGGAVSERAELLLFLADRAQHVAEVIAPALAAGELVLCDRFVHSTLAYQGFGRGFDVARLEDLNGFATGGLLPDLVVLVDVDPDVGRARVLGRGTPDRIEAAGDGFHRRVRDGFLTLAAADPARFVVVDGAQPPERSAALAVERIAALTGRR